MMWLDGLLGFFVAFGKSLSGGFTLGGPGLTPDGGETNGGPGLTPDG